MLKLKKVKYFPMISWVMVLFMMWYVMVISGMIPKYYKVMSSRVMYEKYLYQEMKESEYMINIMKVYYNNWMQSMTSMMNLNMLVSYTKGNMEVKSKKMYYTESEDMNNMGYVFSVNDEMAYASGLLKVQMQMLEMVKFLKGGGKSESLSKMGDQMLSYYATGGSYVNMYSVMKGMFKMTDSFQQLKLKPKSNYSTTIQTKGGMYEEKMMKMYIESFKKEMGSSPMGDEINFIESFILQEGSHMASMHVESMSKDEVEMMTFFHTTKEKDIILPVEGSMEVSKMGEKSHTKFEGVPEKALVMSMSSGEVKSMVEDVTDESLKNMSTTSEYKEKQSEEMFSGMEGSEVDVVNSWGKTEKSMMGEDMSKHSKLDEVMNEMEGVKGVNKEDNMSPKWMDKDY